VIREANGAFGMPQLQMGDVNCSIRRSANLVCDDQCRGLSGCAAGIVLHATLQMAYETLCYFPLTTIHRRLHGVI
jgi:hypothetical protein